MTIASIEKKVVQIIRKYLGMDAPIYLFGSWAKGNARPNSDIDIGIRIHKQDRQNFYRIRTEIDELRTLRKIDIIDLSLVSKKFSKHILKYAIRL